jgi:hypothetical protein
MRRLLASAAGIAAAAGVLAVAAPADAAGHPPTTFAQVIGPVRIDKGDPTVGTVQAIYRCTAIETEPELWVSVKQVGSRRADRALTAEGSSQLAISSGGDWSDSHRDPITCDSKVHVGTFSVDQVEVGSNGQLAKGWGYVQFCLFDDNYPAVGDDPATLAPYSDMHFHLVL